MAESQVNFANETLLSAPIRIPPIPEQRRIAEILVTLDNAIRSTEGLIAKLEQIKQGLLHDLLTRGVDDNGQLRDPRVIPSSSSTTPIGLIPRAWSLSNVLVEVRCPIRKHAWTGTRARQECLGVSPTLPMSIADVWLWMM